MPAVKNRQDNYVKMRDQGINGNNLGPAQRSAVTGQRGRMGWKAQGEAAASCQDPSCCDDSHRRTSLPPPYSCVVTGET